MKHLRNNDLKVGSIYVAHLYCAQYEGKRLVVVINTAPGFVTVVPVRTSNLHRSSKTTLIVPKDNNSVGRKLSVDCGTIITLRRDALLQQIGTMTAKDISKLHSRFN